MTKGWYGDRQQHAMASRGVKSSDEFLFYKSPEEVDFITRTMTPCTKCGEWVNKKHISDKGLCNICRNMARGRRSKESYQIELDELLKRKDMFSKRKYEMFGELTNSETPPSEVRKEEIIAYIKYYDDVLKPNIYEKAFELKDKIGGK